MNKQELLEVLAAAEAACDEAGLWWPGPNGLERVEPVPHQPAPPLTPRWTGKPRRNSRQGRKERGLIWQKRPGCSSSQAGVGRQHAGPMNAVYTKEGNTMHRSIQNLLTTVAEAFGVPIEAIVGSTRRRRIFEARAAVAWLLRQCYPSMGLVEIGDILGGRDHTTVMNALARVEERMADDPTYAALLRTIAKQYAPMVPLSSGAELRRQVRQRRARAVAWWVRQVTPWQPLAA